MLSFAEEKVGLVSMRIEQLHFRIVNSTPWYSEKYVSQHAKECTACFKERYKQEWGMIHLGGGSLGESSKFSAHGPLRDEFHGTEHTLSPLFLGGGVWLVPVSRMALGGSGLAQLGSAWPAFVLEGQQLKTQQSESPTGGGCGIPFQLRNNSRRV